MGWPPQKGRLSREGQPKQCTLNLNLLFLLTKAGPRPESPPHITRKDKKGAYHRPECHFA